MKHHTLLHFGKDQSQESQLIDSTANVALVDEDENPSFDDISVPNVAICSLSTQGVMSPRAVRASTEVLATAKVYAIGRDGRDVTIRCLLDPGSQKHYVTARCCSKLGLNVNRSAPVVVKGIGGASQVIKGSVNMTFKSRFNTKFQFNIQPLVLNQITCSLPTCPVDAINFENFRNIPLADDSWDTPGEIDLLIGVNLFARMLLSGKVVNPPGTPDALETVLGYIVLGEAPTLAQSPRSLALCTTASCQIEALVRKFWEIEEVESKSILNVDDKHCEEFYTATTTRDSAGKYKVALPFKCSPDLLGNSFDVAKRRFLYLERKFIAQPQLKLLYDDVIQDYINKLYLSPVHSAQERSDRCYYIPHHAVVRADKSSTKVRPVLDASAKSNNGLSLNDVLHSGPNLQRDLLTILLNLRLFPIALSADVKQMYLRIEVRKEDRCFQRILYRFRPDNPVQIYEFNSVAFGLRCSPYLALRTIAQLAIDDGARFPLAKEIVNRDLYMDDIVTSIMNPEYAINASQELIALFAAGDFQLVKWSSNCKEVLYKIPEDYRLSQHVEFDKNDVLKILGLCWDPSNDVFTFNVIPDERPCTKRNILSSVARLFDVLGLVAPVILYAKLLIKELWILKVDWDATPPPHIIKCWSQFQTELPLISKLYFPRHLGVVDQCTVTILGFADASQKAYGGVVYVHVTHAQGSNQISLVCAKSKVAPLKVISLARLELCAAVILSQLIKRVYETYSARYPIDAIYAFSDSTVALNWIHSSPHRWHTFVANRVTKIQDNLQPEHFYHIKGSENPSDCLSRGLTPAQLLSHPLWLHGPLWASSSRDNWPVKPFTVIANVDIPELKPVSMILTYEELSTVLTQIECLLNSRPLTVLSSDPSELEALTPAHFLNTSPLKMLPALERLEASPNLLKRYELLDQLIRSFWKRWRGEYLHTLQVRQKWNTPAFPVREGMVVVVMQDNVLPLQWPLGLIVGIYKGKDNVIRVAQVKTKAGILQRPVVKLCPLPSQ
ncbi:uncharacterized protein LOC131851587 [Achroia grisella]|uniref:uncharacterized protein LOC131851587 n=1 Tax=Achroia grisella TaxID=688607 RepID=UPI0027D26BE5|nr:uncharacterized protein LOC131851587 [Achroia grisella]